ncbi:MAG: hypothetical protein ACR2N3_08170, partial [Pyrinomonadaceae bacterium]
NMGMAEFSNIGRGGRDNKNTPLLSGMFDRNSVLRFLNWIKSSLGSILFSTVSAQTSEEKAAREVLTKNTTAFEQNDLATLDKI